MSYILRFLHIINNVKKELQKLFSDSLNFDLRGKKPLNWDRISILLGGELDYYG